MSTSFKDHFSTESGAYAAYRPGYPASLFHYLADQAPARQLAWDCATGTGQAAVALTEHFAQVVATDASQGQIKQAQRHAKIAYQVAPAEQTPFDDQSIDLITVAQALHWFNTTDFFNEVERLLKYNGVVAIWTYNLLRITPEIDPLIEHFYHHTVGPYWPPERRLVEQGYSETDFPFARLNTPAFAMESDWELEQLLGYLATWSAVKRFKQEKQEDPLPALHNQLRDAWGQPGRRRKIHWPLQLMAGKKA